MNCARCDREIPPGRKIPHKKYCSQRCQQIHAREKNDGDKKTALHVYRYMQRNTPAALAKLMERIKENSNV